MKVRAYRSRRARGFTLLEILIAATIFAIVATALFVTFRTGIRAWRTGHAASEIFQTVRIAQDVLIRDLANIAYITDSGYNEGFRRGILAGGPLGGGIQGPESGFSPLPPLPPGSITDPALFLQGLLAMTPPVDLSFRGENSNKLDTLTFTRHERSLRDAGNDFTGLKRIRFYVEDGLLYREESSVYGFRAGERFKNLGDEFTGVGQLASLFSPDSTRRGPIAQELLGEEVNLLPESRQKVSEPLCEGVEVFDIKYGYLREGGWVEAPDWDSSRYIYRFPISEMYGENEGGLGAGVPFPPNITESGFGFPDPYRSYIGKDVNGRMMQVVPQPDNLPGYIAIQLGIRDPEAKGRLRSFTIVVSCPLGREELDPTSIEEAQVGPSKTADFTNNSLPEGLKKK